LHKSAITTRKTVLCVIALLLNGLPLAFGFIGEGIRVGDAVLDPFVEISGTGDSNVQLDTTNEQSDVFAELQVGLQLHYEPGWYTVDGRGFMLFRRYTKFSERDFNNYGERMTLMSGSRDFLSVLLVQSYRVVDDYDRSTYYGENVSPESQSLSLAYDKSIRVKRTLNDVGIILGRNLTDKTGLDLGFSYSSQAYDTNQLYDVVDLLAQAELSYQVTDKSAILLTGQYGDENNGSYVNDATYMVVRGGFRTKSTDKMTLKAGVGIEKYTRDTSRANWKDLGVAENAVYTGPRKEETQDLSVDMTATWIATDKITVEATGRTALQSAAQYVNTVDQVGVASANAVYQLSDSTTVALTGSYRRDNYLDPVFENSILYDRLDERLAGLLRVDYRAPAQFLTIFGEISYEKATSTVPDFNYNQLRLSIGVSVHY
jgi:hypothetical protein